MNLFYLPSLDPSSLNTPIILDAEEAYHAVKVLRMHSGDPISMTDGKGGLYKGVIEVANVKNCLLTARECIVQSRRNFRLHLAVAPTKNIDRYEWFLEKATEIGIEEITPLMCEHSERTKLRMDRLQKILVSAMKQSMNLYLPRLNELMSFEEFMKQDISGGRYMGYVEEKQEQKLKELYRIGTDATILIGPEGDFSKAEVQQAVKSGYSLVSLGNTRLRTETAAVYACMAVGWVNV